MTDGVNLPIVLTVRLCQTVKVWNQTWIKLTWFFALCHPFLTFFWSDRVRWQTRLDKMKTHVPDSSTSGLQNKTLFCKEAQSQTSATHPSRTFSRLWYKSLHFSAFWQDQQSLNKWRQCQHIDENWTQIPTEEEEEGKWGIEWWSPKTWKSVSTSGSLLSKSLSIFNWFFS